MSHYLELNTFLIIIFFVISGFLNSQESDTLNSKLEPNKIFMPNIKTVQLYRDGWEMSPPLIKFNTAEKLKLSFDDLDGDRKVYMYTIVHCNPEWEPEDLENYQYIDGYYEDYITDYWFSMNTIQPYTHYELIFPTQDLAPAISGNYILKVFIENPDSICFTRQFMVVDQKVKFEAKVKQATQLDDRKTSQEIDFEVIANQYRIINPYRDLNVVIRQNGRWDNAISNLKPKMVIGDKLDFNYDRENVFRGGNEFRNIDFKSLTYYTENVIKIDYTGEGYQVFVREGEKRTFQVYKTESDINGRFIVKTEDRTQTATEAEYVYTHFFLAYPVPLIDGDIYIMGELTNWNFNEQNKMTYNFKRKGYEKTLYLKQGFYDYAYILLNHGEKVADESFIEGSHWETENDYTIYIYNRNVSLDYDELIGVHHLNSLTDR
ncbi:MAG: DUF5103 domain-containing protein [Bacteroidales bacterium]|nr:DUF5103 domain-containing protein [Bacteroidales bacterium]